MISVPQKARRWSWTRRGGEFRPPEKCLGNRKKIFAKPWADLPGLAWEEQNFHGAAERGTDLDIGATFGRELAVARKGS